MSADNFLAVLKEGDKYVGYHCSASVAGETPHWKKCYICKGSKDFEANTLEEAIYCCEHFDEDGMGYLEYGYRFVDQGEYEEPEEGFCAICAHNPSLLEMGSEEARVLGCNCTRESHEMFDGELMYSYSLGDDCPIHSNIRWQKKVGLFDYWHKEE